MLVNSVTVNRIGQNIDRIVTNYGKFKDTQFVVEQFFKGKQQVERHIQVIKPNSVRNNVKILGKDGKFQSWG